LSPIFESADGLSARAARPAGLLAPRPRRLLKKAGENFLTAPASAMRSSAASSPFGKADQKILTVSYVQARRGCEDLSLCFSRSREKMRLIKYAKNKRKAVVFS